MKIKVKNLGPLKQAEFTLGEMTIICGNNNTGKTYATYALFGFLDTWRQIFSIEINAEIIEQLLVNGVISLDIQEYVQQAKQIIRKACNIYTQQLPNIFATSKERFKSTEFQINPDMQNIDLVNRFEQTMSTANAEFFYITKNEKSTKLVINLLVENENLQFSTGLIERIIADAIKHIIFSPLFPRPFIASAERTGAAIFRQELNFSRNRLLE